jgi:hypothetical protein
MWDLYLNQLVANLFPWSKPGSRAGYLGTWKICTRCQGIGYVKRNAQVWQACPECYAGHRLFRSTLRDADLSAAAGRESDHQGQSKSGKGRTYSRS